MFKSIKFLKLKKYQALIAKLYYLFIYLFIIYLVILILAQGDVSPIPEKGEGGERVREKINQLPPICALRRDKPLV